MTNEWKKRWKTLEMSGKRNEIRFYAEDSDYEVMTVNLEGFSSCEEADAFAAMVQNAIAGYLGSFEEKKFEVMCSVDGILDHWEENCPHALEGTWSDCVKAINSLESEFRGWHRTRVFRVDTDVGPAFSVHAEGTAFLVEIAIVED